MPLPAQVEFRSWLCCADTQQESPGTSGGAGGRTHLSQRMSPQLARPSLCGGRIQSCKVLPGCVGSFPEKVTGGREVHASLSVSGRPYSGGRANGCLHWRPLASVLPRVLRGSGQGSDTCHAVMVGPACAQNSAVDLGAKGRSGLGWHLRVLQFSASL